ncbi:MAG: hypothetical protein II661_04320 [Bacteroidales bacterium]|nr:hypothetical protein [Bacteroidales bacterium]
MAAPNKNSNTTFWSDIWTSTTTLSDTEVLIWAASLLPEIQNKTYTRKEMLDMFRKGYDYACTHAQKMMNGMSIKKPFTVIRSMSVGERLILPSKYWNNARSAASKLKKSHGRLYKVRSTTDYGKEGDIEVIRLA